MTLDTFESENANSLTPTKLPKLSKPGPSIIFQNRKELPHRIIVKIKLQCL